MKDDPAEGIESHPSLRERLRQRRKPLGIAGAVLATGMTVLWTVVVPEKVNATQGLQEIAIRWGHPLCWALLAAAGLLVALDAPKRLRDGVAVAAGVSYAAFVAGMLA